MVIVSVYLCLHIPPHPIFQTALLIYQNIAQFASMRDKRAAVIELHRASKTNSEIMKLLLLFDNF